MNTGAFGENFPYSNFHDLNMDWIVKIAKDFLDQYTHIQQVIADGETLLNTTTSEGVTTLQNKADEIETLLNQWYETHSNDIAIKLAQALASFNTQATAKASEVLASIPADYTELANQVETLRNSLAGVVNWQAGYHSFTDGSVTGTTSSYHYSTRVIGQFAFANPQVFNNSPSNYVSLWNNDIYVGYYIDGQYKNPAGTIIEKPEYDSYSVNMYTAVYDSLVLLSIPLMVEMIANETVATGYTWHKGYYSFTTAMPGGENTDYHRTDKQFSYPYKFNGMDFFNADPSNFISFWNMGEYVGYYINGTYHLPDGTVTGVIAYDTWALNIWTASYVLITPVTLESRIEKLENQSSNYERYQHLRNKKIGILGDSITAGIGASDFAHSFVGLMSNEFGDGNVYGYGINASLIANSASIQINPNSMATRYANMSDDLDIVVVFGGINDWYYGTGWGDDASTDISTFNGALNVLMSGLEQKYPGKEIIFVTPYSADYASRNTDGTNPQTGKTLLDYRNAIMDKARYHAIPVIDLYGEGGMDIAHSSNAKTYYTADGLHPNDNGHKRIHDRIITFISNMLY